ncbi:TPA: hypothetical protein N0F65_001811 [Lagenidium giganteum]|uniref:Sodium/hydrogen exchanger n=1 Tax=Lagenidium giganteum TaxID=4803 RepID=A0AAV2Z4T6_9STRA|nr:TPA: hypothetical protein N0F65_001811 [Lagenidium giganteum]
MGDAILVLVMLFALVMASFMLDRYSCMLLSQSGFALLFGLVVGAVMVLVGAETPLHSHLNLDNNLFFDVLLPPIIYEGGFSIKRKAFFRSFPAIMSTAVIGTIIATSITGGALYWAGRYGLTPEISWVEAFLFGSLISAVDPVATLACFNKLNAPPLLFNLVFGESVLNDAVAIALFQTLMKWKPDADLNTKNILLIIANTGGMFVGSLLVSMIITLSGAFLLKRKQFSTLRYFPSYEISLCLIFSLLTYFVADALHLSGIVALFFSGTMTAHYHFHTISKEAQHSFTHLLHTLSFVCENFVYVFMGTSVVMMFAGRVAEEEGATLQMSDMNWSFIGLTVVVCVVARFFNIFPLLSLSNCFRTSADRISVKFMSVIWFAGLRGSIAFALAKNWSYVGLNGVSHRKLMESTTMMVVLFTTVVIGGLTGPLLSALRLVKPARPQSRGHDSGSETSTSSLGSVRMSPPSRPTQARGSTHYAMNRVGEELIHNSLAELSANNEQPLDPVLTPRPQFRDSSSDDDDDEVVDEWDGRDSLRPQRPSMPRVAMLRQESHTTAFFRSWQLFDSNFMQPIFGGQSQPQYHPPSRRAGESGINGLELAKLRSEHAL